MPGIRLYHPTKRDVTLLIPHPGDPATGRKPKDYHVRLDTTGHVIVSERVWQRLRESEKAGWPHGLVVSNEVKKPPAQTVGWNGDRKVPRIERVTALRGQELAAIERLQREGRVPDGKPKVRRLRKRDN